MQMVLSLIANKGGVSKTTSSTVMAHILAVTTGRPVLFLDLDPQANATQALGVTNSTGEGLLKVVDGNAPISDHAVHMASKVDWGEAEVPDNLWLLEGGPAMAQAKVSLATDVTKLYNLAEQLDDPAYDDWIAVIDTGPDFSSLTNVATMAATDIIVPTKARLADYQGSLRIYPTLQDVIKKLRIDVNFAGLLLTQWDGRDRSAVQRDVSDLALANDAGLPGGTFPTMVQQSARVVESYGLGMPVSAYWPSASAAQDYLAVTLDLLRNRSAAALDGEPIEVVRDTLPDAYAEQA